MGAQDLGRAVGIEFTEKHPAGNPFRPPPAGWPSLRKLPQVTASRDRTTLHTIPRGDNNAYIREVTREDLGPIQLGHRWWLGRVQPDDPATPPLPGASPLPDAQGRPPADADLSPEDLDRFPDEDDIHPDDSDDAGLPPPETGGTPAAPSKKRGQYSSDRQALTRHLYDVVQNGHIVLTRPGLDGEVEHLIAKKVVIDGREQIVSVIVRQRADGRQVLERGMMRVQDRATFERRLDRGEEASDGLVDLPGGPEDYGGEDQRRALRNLVNRANTQAEAEGLIFGFQEMRKKGYQLENVSLHYRGNQGLDMIFRSSSGPPVIYAVVEAKSGATMGAVKTSRDEMRQGSREYNLDRLEKYLRSSDLAHEEMARMLQAEAIEGRLLSFISLKRSGRIVEVNDDE